MKSLGALTAPLLICSAMLAAALRGVDVYDALLTGARRGMKTAVEILPALLVLYPLIYLLRASGLLELLGQWLSPLLQALGVPEETAPLMLLRPISGSGALSVASDIIIYRRLRDQLLMKTDFMVVEKSREGYDRSKVTSLVMEVRLQSERVQKGLDLLLMNVKSKKGKGSAKDALSEFMEKMQEE